MKKSVKKSNNNLESFAKEFHDMWDSCDDEMDRLELKHFVDNENQPKIEALEATGDDIGVKEVLIIGSYLALNFLHDKFHEAEVDEIKNNIERMFNGEVELKEIAPKNMPPELLDILGEIVDIGRDMKKKTKKPRGKK